MAELRAQLNRGALLLLNHFVFALDSLFSRGHLEVPLGNDAVEAGAIASNSVQIRGQLPSAQMKKELITEVVAILSQHVILISFILFLHFVKNFEQCFYLGNLPGLD